MYNWQPIETAPKDKNIFIATPEHEWGFVIVKWCKYNGLEAWRDLDADPYFRATHWMPLPGPPKENQ